MTIHIGSEIKDKVKKSGMSITEFSRRLNTSRENVYSIFNRASIHTETLKEIGQILNYDFFAFYTPVTAEVASLKKQVEQLKITLDQILKIQKD